MTGAFMSFGSEGTGLHKPLIIVGFSARAAAQCALRAGFQTIVVDYCADRDLLAYCHVYRSLEDAGWVDWIEECYPGIPMLLAGGMEHRPNAVQACQQHSNRGGSTGTQLVAMRCLENWQRWALASGLEWPFTISTTSCVQKASISTFCCVVVVVVVVGGGGKHIVIGLCYRWLAP